MNTLSSPLIRLSTQAAAHETVTLPGAMAALARDDVTSFIALRPHQRHAWHAFTVQVGTLALLRAGRGDLPNEEADWAELLRGLTPDYTDDAPWCLYTAPDRPALLQAPLPGGDQSGLRNLVPTPDCLDVLITSRNHDLKAGAMVRASPDDWLFSLVTLQTMEGFLGAGNYGISRMNGGFASRPALGLAPRGGPGAHFARDVRRLLAMDGRMPLTNGFAQAGGLALVWLRPWNGKTSIPRSELDPLYIEICRQVRLQNTGAGIVARAGGSPSSGTSCRPPRPQSEMPPWPIAGGLPARSSAWWTRWPMARHPASVTHRIAALETKLMALDRSIAEGATPAPRLHPNLPRMYRERMASLADALSKEPNGAAVAALRGVIDEIRLVPVAGALHVELRGEITAIFALGLSEGPAVHAEKTVHAAAILVRQVKMVAGTRSHLWRTKVWLSPYANRRLQISGGACQG